MTTLRRGSGGDEVEELQKRLRDAGFSPGAIDGRYGPGTEAAVSAFQASEGLLVDGIAGPRTLAAIGIESEPEPPLAIEGVTVDLVSDLFPGAPLDNIKTHLPRVLEELVSAEIAEKPMVLMALATIRAETAGFAPIDEFRSRFNSSPGGHPFDLYDHRADLGNQGSPDGERFKGRGFIQLTGRDNYRRIGQRIGLGDGLVQDPELANDSTIAARILAAFLAEKELRIKTALLHGDLAEARRAVNGGRHGIEAFSQTYRKGEALLA